MTATVIRFETAALRVRIRRAAVNVGKLKGLKKVEPGPYVAPNKPECRCAGCSVPLNSRQYIGVIKRGEEFTVLCWPCVLERDVDPDVLLESCESKLWTTCLDCWREMPPGTGVIIDHNTAEVRCVRCFNEGPP